MLKRPWGRAALACALVLASSVGQAQSFPTRSVTIYVTTSAGGTLDIMARLLADHLRRKSSQSITVENRPGAGGALALAATASAPADGHTIVFAGNPYVQSLLVKDIGYDPTRLTPVSILSRAPFTVVASKASNLRNVKEFIAYAKTNPGRLTLGAVTGSHELEMRALEQALGITTTIVPYKGFAPLEIAVLSGEVNGSIFGNLGRVKSGQIVAIVTAGDQRGPEIPDVPTFRELGVDHDPNAGYTAWARSETPADLLDRLARECQELVRSPEYTAAVTQKLGITAVGSSREVALKHMTTEREKYRRVAERAGIRPQ